jgi:outer membrane receptor protein involved in Fe transport
MDLTWNPTTNLSIGASGAVTNARTTSNLCAFEGDSAEDCSGIVTTHETQYPGGVATDVYTDHQDYIAAPVGTRLPVTPKLKLAANARYSWQVGDLSPYWQVDATYQAGASTDIRVAEAALMGDLKEFTTINFALGTEWKSWTLEAYIRNLTDERGQLSKYVQCSICYQRSYIVPTTPRTFGLRLGSKF